MYKNHPFSIKVSEKAAEDWTLLYLAVEFNNLSIVELLLKKKVSVNARVKNVSKDDGLTSLHIAALRGHQDMVKQLVNDERVNPSLKSKNKTPREMVGENKEAVVKMLEAAEESYRTKPQKKAKDLNIKLQYGSTYYLFQGNHMTPASSVVNENNV